RNHYFFFFFQAEDGIRAFHVTGVQTCALPIWTVPDTPFEVEFAESGRVVEVGAEETILEAAERAGLAVVSSCKTGTCGTCETPIVSGRADHRDSILTPSEQEAGRTMLICVSRAAADCPRLVLGG